MNQDQIPQPHQTTEEQDFDEQKHRAYRCLAHKLNELYLKKELIEDEIALLHLELERFK